MQQANTTVANVTFSNGKGIEVVGPDGEIYSFVELQTNLGANQYLDAHSNCNFISELMKDVEKHYGHISNGIDVEEAKNALTSIFFTIVAIGKHASKEKLMLMDPKTEFMPFIEHVNNKLKGHCISERSVWKREGKLDVHDNAMLTCVIVFTTHMKAFFDCLFDAGFVDSLTEFLTALDDDVFPELNMANLLIVIVWSMFAGFQVHSKLPAERALKIFHRTGLLEQTLLLITQPATNAHAQRFLDALSSCPTLLRKTFGPNTVSGKMLIQITSGELGFQPKTARHQEINMRFENLCLIAGHVAECHAYQRQSSRKCYVCNKSSRQDGVRIFQCSRCKVSSYCSKECQIADWRDHKTTCQPLSSKHAETVTGGGEGGAYFCIQNYEIIMKAYIAASKTFNVSYNDLVLVVDYMVGPNGVSPALMKPPVFEVVKAEGYVPEWYNDSSGKFAREFKRNHDVKGKESLLVITRLVNGSVVFLVVDSPAGTKVPIFGKRAFDRIARIHRDG